MEDEGFGMSLAKSAGAGIVNGAIGQGMGLLFGKMQDKRQLRQNQKLMEQQIAGAQQMGRFNNAQALQMWKDTNYSAQIEEAKKAGMSISALYGGSGAGGATTQGGGGSMPSTASAGDPNAGVGMGMQMASQIALMKAQTDNIKADTLQKLKGADKAGTETEGQELTNRGLKVDVVNKEALADELRSAMLGEAKTKTVEGVVADQTQQQQIRIKQQEVIKNNLENALTQGKIKLTNAQINEISEKIAQGWKGLQFQGVDKVTGKYLEELADTVKKIVTTGN